MTDQQRQTENFTDKLRQVCVGCRLAKKRWGVKKTLDKSQKGAAAAFFGAETKRLSASKSLIDTVDEDYRAVTGIFSRITDEWKSRTLPFPEDGLRLLKREHVEAFEVVVSKHQTELDHAVAKLERAYPSMLDNAREQLGSLFCLSDYPSSLEGLFAISVEYPSINADPALAEVSSDLYHREQQRIAARFDEALEMAETAFTEEFQGLVAKLCERLQGLNDGTVKQFHPSNVENLGEFFARFKNLSIGSNADLDRLVDDASAAVRGIQPDWLQTSQPLRDSIRGKLGNVQKVLDEMMVARPKRAISFDE